VQRRETRGGVESGFTAPGSAPFDYRPNNLSISQPSSPAAASGRADGLGGGAEARVGGGRYEPPEGAGASGTGAGADCVGGGALSCDAV
jgi:hypothetical protein